MIKGLRYVRAVVRDYLVNVCARVTAPHNRRENSYKVFPTLTFNGGKTSVQTYVRLYVTKFFFVIAVGRFGSIVVVYRFRDT